MVKIVVTGCIHGDLDNMYKDIKILEEKESITIDIVLCCGDFQSIRNKADLEVLSVPLKFRKIGDFWQYYGGYKVAPYLTLFIGGNHEASNFLQELPYGGWVAQNIYYLGYAGVVNFKGLRIGGLSGIYKKHDFYSGHYEHAPYDDQTKRTAYHVRNIDSFRLKQINKPMDIMLSHDWPRGIYNYGDNQTLLKYKPHFKDDIRDNSMGNPAAEEILVKQRPRYWFSAHMHAKFCANIFLNDTGETVKFLALDKCLPNKHYIQYLEIEPRLQSTIVNDYLSLDPEWLCILKSTNHLMSINKTTCIMPDDKSKGKSSFTTTDEDIKQLNELFNNKYKIPENFQQTAPCYDPTQPNVIIEQQVYTNHQTDIISTMLELMNPNANFLGAHKTDLNNLTKKSKKNEDSLSEDDEISSVSNEENPDKIDLDNDSSSSEDDSGDDKSSSEDKSIEEPYEPTELDNENPNYKPTPVDNSEKELENEYEPPAKDIDELAPEYKPDLILPDIQQTNEYDPTKYQLNTENDESKSQEYDPTNYQVTNK